MRNQASLAAAAAAGGGVKKLPHPGSPPAALLVAAPTGAKAREKSPELGFSDPVVHAVVSTFKFPAFVV